MQRKEDSPQTSERVENRLKARPSGAVHLMGNLAPACAVYVSSFISRARPKSATFTKFVSATRQFLAARSLSNKVASTRALWELVFEHSDIARC